MTCRHDRFLSRTLKPVPQGFQQQLELRMLERQFSFNDESINTKSNFPSFAIRTISLSVFCVEPLEYPQNNLSKAFSIKISFVINVPPVNEKAFKAYNSTFSSPNILLHISKLRREHTPPPVCVEEILEETNNSFLLYSIG